MKLYSKIHVVLVEPQSAGNIGSVARAIKTMGFNRLTLVNPQGLEEPQAGWMAAHARDVLEKAKIFSSLDEALHGSQRVIGLTARLRRVGPAAKDIRVAFPELLSFLSQETVNTLSLVFGNERSGLSNEDLNLCHYCCSIDADPVYGVLNLAQAVQVVLYELRSQMKGHSAAHYPAEKHREWSCHEDYERLYAHWEKVLIQSGYLDPKEPRQLMRHLRQIFGRRPLDKSEMALLRGILSSIES
jgi:TrmH family RNA methyltransferase